MVVGNLALSSIALVNLDNVGKVVNVEALLEMLSVEEILKVVFNVVVRVEFIEVVGVEVAMIGSKPHLYLGHFI